MSSAYILSKPFPLTGNEIVDVTTNGYKWYFPAGTPRVLNWSVSSSLWTHPILQSTETQADFTRAFGNIQEFIDVQFNFLGYIAGANGLTGYENAYLSGSDLNITYAYNGTNSSGATISDGKFTTNSQSAFCYFPDLDYNSKYLGAAGDTFLNYNNSFLAKATFESGTASFALLLHEVLHGLGLKHPHDSGGTGRPTYTKLDIKFADRQWISVMSYDLHENGGDGAYSGSQPIGPMLLDAIALQYLYGESTFNSGNTTYDLNRYLGNYYNCQWDASGTDLLDGSNLTYGVVVELDGGQMSNGINLHHVGFVTTALDYLALSLANPTKWTWLWGEYENVNGSPYDDVISGNDLDNVINGGSGDDYLTGGSGDDTFDWDSSLRDGDDTFIGGLGDDIYVLNSPGDTVQEDSFEGVDTVFVGFNYSIANTAIENIKTFNNQTTAVTFTGNAWKNILEGGAGNDFLYGNEGADTLNGGLGNDLIDGGSDTDYAVYSSVFSELSFKANGNEIIVTSKTEGVDTLRNVEYVRASGVDYKLSNILASSSPTYAVTTSSSSVNEGSTAQFSLVTTNVAAGTVIAYSISGVSAADLQSGVLTGSVTVSSTGTTTISISIKADGITEGSETLTVTAQGKSASIVINDTSTAANTVQVYDTDLAGKLLTNGAKRYSGTSGNDTISGTAGGDLIYGNDGDDKLYGLAGNDQVSGLNGNDYLSGGDGDDRLFGSKGDDQIYGGKGSDTATYDGEYSNYAVTALYDGKNAVSGYKVVDKTGKEGTDTISTDVEFLEFNYGRTIVTLSNGTITAKTTNNAPTGAVSISGTVRQNETLTVSNSISDADGVGAVTYKWRVSTDNKTWTDLSSGSSLKLTESEVGKYLFAYASYVDGKGNSESVSSTASAAVVNVNDSPVGSVSITGTAKSGQVLTASNNLTDLDGLGTISYVWQSSSDGLAWANLSNGSTITVSNTLVGKYLRANATYTDGRGTSESVPSLKTEAVKSLTQQTTTESHNLSVIVDKGILGVDAVLLKGLTESITMTDGVITAHSLMYAGSTFDYNQIDALIMTVTRDDEFTAEFTKEINDYLKTEANIAYKVAVGLVGAASIDGIIMTVAGADGSYVS
jgi:Ca2+-binding RTX toxin-like protein